MNDKIVIITNLYPLPWQPTRATFNYQQFSKLSERLDVYLLIPVAFPDWLKHRKKIIADDSRVLIVPYIYIPKIGRRFYALLMYWSLLIMAGHWLREISPNKILASWAYPDGVAAQKIAKKLNADFYLKVHGTDINHHGSCTPRAKQITRMANNAKGVLCVSADLAEKMSAIGVNPNLNKVIYNGVNLEKFKPKEEKDDDQKHPPFILFIGNLIKEKGVFELVEAYEILQKINTDIELHFIGGGPTLAELKRIVSDKDLSVTVKFLGLVAHDKLPEYLSNAKILVLPSYREGVPNVILEAMACGVPVVASKVGGIPEVVNEDTGVLVQSFNADGIAEAMIKALDSSWSANNIRAYAEKFSWDDNVKQLMNMLDG